MLLMYGVTQSMLVNDIDVTICIDDHGCICVCVCVCVCNACTFLGEGIPTCIYVCMYIYMYIYMYSIYIYCNFHAKP